MATVFDFNKRSAELIAQGVPDEEAVAIMEREAAQADFTVLDDGAFWRDLAESFAEIEAEVDAQIEAERQAALDPSKADVRA